ncbi:hypothetical protein K2Z84_18060 [Candidatus Binatia bacterium]|jgi:hypothetical protein|nr:hypothetical protein [Candidatus Binatia bacterium]
MKATRSSRRLLTWLCITALAALVVQTNAAVVLCVANDHTAVEAVHEGLACAGKTVHTHSLGAPDAGCTDTPLLRTSIPTASERQAHTTMLLARLTVVIAAAPESDFSFARLDVSPPPRELDRALPTIVLVL